VFGSVRNKEDADRLQSEFGDLFAPLLFDVTDESAVQNAAAKVSEMLGDETLDGLVNNAGIVVSGPLLYLRPSEYKRQLEVNMISPLVVIQAFAPLLGTDKKRQGTAGRIVNIGSVGGKVSVPHLLPYSAAKFATVGFSEGLRAELAGTGVTVTTIAPGLMRTGSPLNAFFGRDPAVGLRDGLQVRADVFLANNVLAHVPDLNGFVEGICTLLKPDGVAVIEVPYVADLVDHCEFDTIYHQHLCYFSVTALDALFSRHGLFLNDVERTTIHGGSLRLFVEKHDDRRQRVAKLLATERARRIDDPSFYADFVELVVAIKEQLSTLRALLRTAHLAKAA